MHRTRNSALTGFGVLALALASGAARSEVGAALLAWLHPAGPGRHTPSENVVAFAFRHIGR